MPTRLYLVRHGATQLSAENRSAGAVGVDLSEEGDTSHYATQPREAIPNQSKWWDAAAEGRR